MMFLCSFDEGFLPLSEPQFSAVKLGAMGEGGV